MERVMFRETGFGEVDVDLDFSGIGVLKATLWNFDFDILPVTNFEV
jgi:hypothetical protein